MTFFLSIQHKESPKHVFFCVISLSDEQQRWVDDNWLKVDEKRERDRRNPPKIHFYGKSSWFALICLKIHERPSLTPKSFVVFKSKICIQCIIKQKKKLNNNNNCDIFVVLF